jgi:hypothetical protein
MKWQLFALSAVLLLAQSPVQAACIMPIHFHLTSEGPWNGHGDIQQGQTCKGYYRTGRIATFRKLYLTEPPAHGTLLLHEGGTYSYTAQPVSPGATPSCFASVARRASSPAAARSSTA